MKKKMKIIIIILSAVIFGFLLSLAIKKYIDYKEELRIRNAIIKIEFIEPLEVLFNSEVKVSDVIKSINGELVTDPVINTKKVGNIEVSFQYINEEDIKIPYKFSLSVVDKVPPFIGVGESLSVTKGYKKQLTDVILCADDYDDNPLCTVKGEYNFDRVGNYPLTMEAVDFSGNKTIKNFLLKVTNSSKSSSKNSKTIPFKSLYNEYKNDHTSIGIDVSKWQGNIDYEKVKNEGVEFVFIKLGGQNGLGKDYYLDPKFEQNYEGFKSVNIPIGLYFYSYANNEKQAIKDALWVIDQIKDKEIDLPIAFDWENWSSFNQFHMSFNTLTLSGNAFIDTLKKYGYSGMLYSSKYYLENMWLKNNNTIWLAHYTDKTDYEGEYKCWQRTSSAKISGITANTVDFDICYK